MAELFGFEIRRKQDVEPVSFVQKDEDDGAVNIAATGGAYGTYVDLEGTAKSEAELVTRYRKMCMQPEVEHAIDDIINEAIVTNTDKEILEINLDDVQLSAGLKNKIRDEFRNTLRLLNFQDNAYEIFRKWYTDGRMYYHAIINEQDPRNGLIELRYIDSRKIRKIKETTKQKKGEAIVQKVKNEYYIFNDKGFQSKSSQVPNPATGGVQGLKIAKDSIIHCTSGLMDENNKMVLSHLHKAIKPLNQLRVLEDASVIYRISRAPERRIFYIDVGNLPKMKAEQYLRDMMVKHKNRLVYDAASGEIRDDRKFMTMLEDFWLPRREGGRGTEITSLPGGSNLGEMDDIIYFQKKLYKSLNVPISRLEPETGFTLGRASEISRDELKFSKFVSRLRLRFSHLFDKILEKQLVLKGVMSTDEWMDIKELVRYDFIEDNHFSELKDAEVLRERLQTLNEVENYTGKYFSKAWIQRHVLKMDEEEIKAIEGEIAAEEQSGELDVGSRDENEQ